MLLRSGYQQLSFWHGRMTLVSLRYRIIKVPSVCSESYVTILLSLSLSEMEGPAFTRGPQRNQRQVPVGPRQWRVRPFAELHAKADKHRFILDDGESARTENSMQHTINTDSSLTREEAL